MSTIVDAEPEPLPLDLAKTALVMIDMQRDFLEPGGFGESLGNDVTLLGKAVGPCRALLEAMRARGEKGLDLIEALAPRKGEPVIDKPGKGAFYATDLQAILHNRGVETLIVCGVTTEVCVHTTVREANDRGYKCLVPGDCCASYFPEFHEVGLRMIKAQGAIFGWVTDSTRLLAALR